MLNSSGIAPATILPVVLGELYGEYSNNQVTLVWSTQSELNFDHFTVERSADDFSWNEIGTVATTGDASGSHYSFGDESVFIANPNYRLRMTDKDGKITYSKVISVNTALQTGGMSIFPNPITDLHFTLKLKEVNAADITVFSMEGHMLYHMSLSGDLQYSVKLPQSVASIKWLIIRVKSGEKTSSFTVLNKQ